MPLISLQTDLKSLKYGHDRPDGGNSSQPYIQTDINNPVTTLSSIIRTKGLKKLLEKINNSPDLGISVGNVDDLINRIGSYADAGYDDGFIRGGIIRSTDASLTDTIRISKFFLDPAKGPLFIARQAGLQLSNPRLETKRLSLLSTRGFFTGVKNIIKSAIRGDYNNILATATGGLLEPTRIYNAGINTIAQIPSTAFGVHFNRHGLLPIQNENSKYESIVRYNDDLDYQGGIYNHKQKKGIHNGWRSVNNRLLRLKTKFELGDGFDIRQKRLDSPIGPNAKRDARKEIRKINRNGLPADPTTGTEGFKGRKATHRANRKQKKKARKQRAIYFNPGSPGWGRIIFSATEAFLPYASLFPIFKLKTYNYTRENFQRKNLDAASGIIDRYLGGPDSVYGIGFTTIKRTHNTEADTTILELLKETIQKAGIPIDDEGKRNHQPTNEILAIQDAGTGSLFSANSQKIGTYPELPTDPKEIAKGISLPAFSTYEQLALQIDGDQDFQLNSSNVGLYNSIRVGKSFNSLSSVTDHQNGVINSRGHYNIEPLSGSEKIAYENTYGENVTLNFNKWDDISRENRVGEFGKAKTRFLSKKTTTNGTLIPETKELRAADTVNLSPAVKRDKYWSGDPDPNNSNSSDWIADKQNGILYNVRDFVKFRIQSIDSDDPSNSMHMIFRAFITSFSDSVDTEWNDISYVGRGNKFYVYKGFGRKVQIGFKVAALSAAEMQPMYSKLNYLMASLMPDYTSNNLMRGPLHRLTVGNYFDCQFGKIDSLSYTISNDSPWEIALDEPEGGTSQLILPHILEVSMNFTPIGAETQGSNLIESKTKNTTFIAQNNTGKDKGIIQYNLGFWESAEVDANITSNPTK